MHSGSGNHNQNVRPSNDRDGRRHKTRWDDPGTQVRSPAFYDQGGFPPPQGKYTRFGYDDKDNGKEEVPAAGSKRERSRERSGHENSRSHRDRDLDDRDGRQHQSSLGPHRNSAEPSKRPKREHAPDFPAIPGDFQVLDASSEFDELDTLTSLPQTTNHVRSSNSRPTHSSSRSDSSTEVKPERPSSGIFDLGRAGYTALKNLVSTAAKPQDPETVDAPVSESSQVLEALESAALAQSELEFLQQELRQAQDECRALQGAEQRAQYEVQRLTAAFQTERAELMSQCFKQSAYIDKANVQIHSLMEENRDLAQKYEKRIEGLILERGNVNSQLKQQLRTPPDARPTNGPKADDISLDPFDNKLDQVSESTVKSGVDSLNDSLDTFTMALLDEAEELAKHNSHSSLPSAIREHEKATKLLMALAKYSHVEEKRGFLLDAHLHHGLVVELDRLFFSGEVVCRVLDTQRVCAATLNKLTKQEPWTVAQRWRALTAAAVGTILNPSVTKNSITHYSESTVALLAWAYRQPLETFEPLIPKIQSQLASLYEEASKLSVIVRRDVLSVRMSVVVAPVDPKAANDYLPYNPDAVTSVWPDMKVVAGDEVIALYKFGLKKYNENRQIHRLIKPEVTTTALLREMAKI